MFNKNKNVELYIDKESVLDYIYEHQRKDVEDITVFYDLILLDERLKVNSKNRMSETPETIRLWQTICREYEVDKDPLFFIYALYRYLNGNNLEFGLCFLYGEDKSLRNDDKFNKLLKSLAEKDITDYTEYRGITREEKIRDNRGMDLCPFGDAIGSAAPLCRKYKSCRECQENTYEDKIYTSFATIMHNSRPKIYSLSDK